MLLDLDKLTEAIRVGTAPLTNAINRFARAVEAQTLEMQTQRRTDESLM